MLEQIQQLLVDNLTSLSDTARVLLVVNLVLLVFSRPLLKFLLKGREDEGGDSKKLHIFRAVNLFILLFVLFSQFLAPHLDKHWINRILGVMVIFYLTYLLFHVMDYVISNKFGRRHQINGEERISATYRSRLISLLLKLFIIVIAVIAVVQSFGFESLLEKGVIGFLGVMLALSQGAWAPDLISGLVILNSNLVEEGDVIEFMDGETILGSVFKTKIFHTEILNLKNNHRIMIQNARLRSMTLHNLSKFASARGLRESLKFNVGYDTSSSKIEEMAVQAFRELDESGETAIENQLPVEIRITDVGDYAVEWTLFYYTKDVRHLLRTRQSVMRAMFETSKEMHISLATPLLHSDEKRVASSE